MAVRGTCTVYAERVLGRRDPDSQDSAPSCSRPTMQYTTNGGKWGGGFREGAFSPCYTVLVICVGTSEEIKILKVRVC